MYGHKIKSKSVDVIFFCPVLNGVDDEVAHLLTLRGCLVAAARSVAIGAVLAMAVVISGSCEREVGAVVVGGVVVDHVHNHTNAVVMKRFYHLLHLSYTCGWIGRVG